MDIFGEENNSCDSSGDCCDVCMLKNSDETKYADHKELKILLEQYRVQR